MSLVPKKWIPTLTLMLPAQAPGHFDPKTQASWKLSPVVSELGLSEPSLVP